MNRKISTKAQKTLEALTAKADFVFPNKNRMPSISSIHALLNELGIKHDFDEEVVNVVEYRSAGKTYVNERYDGKIGKRITIWQGGSSQTGRRLIELDTSLSYYSWNSRGYANELLEIIAKKLDL